MSKAFPEAFLSYLKQALPEADVQGLLLALEQPAPVSIRMNGQKLPGVVPAGDIVPVPWCPDGYYLAARPLFTADPAFHAGGYYVQEASSMWTGEIVKHLLTLTEAEAMVLDLCAAPGGKSTHIASVLRENDILVANEVISSRTAILHENLCKWGAANHVVTRADASFTGRSGVQFDIIVADMPCSGEGMFRKDPESVKEWSAQHVELCADRQMRIAADIWPALKPGGYLVYSTCTYNRLENEENVSRIMRELGAEAVIPPIPMLNMLTSSEPGMFRAMPHQVQGEGFFIAVLRKTSEEPARDVKAKPWFKNRRKEEGLWPRELQVFESEKGLYGLKAENWTERIAGLPGIYAAGIPCGKFIRDAFKPEAALALMQGMNGLTWPAVVLNDTEALKYLRRDPLPNPEGRKGLHLATWNGMTLGWLNGHQKQWNNLWPMEWRLRMEIKEVQTVPRF